MTTLWNIMSYAKIILWVLGIWGGDWLFYPDERGSRFLQNIVTRLPIYQTTWCNIPEELVHLIVCLTIGPKSLPKRALHIVQFRASSFKWKYPLFSLRSSSGFLRLLPHLAVTSIPPFIFPSITHCRRKFLCKMWPIQLAFHLLI